MDAIPRVLLLDDGELDDLAVLLEKLELEYTRLRGGEILSDVSPPLDLVVATPRRSSSVLKRSPDGARPGGPMRVIVTEEDSNSMRQMLRQAGYQLLVRRPTHPEIWRLLIQRATYQGDERRGDTRLPAGSDIQIEATGEEHLALLLDISPRGCRLSSREPLSPGSVVTVSIPCSPADGMAIEISGEVVRCDASRGKGEGFIAALIFVSLAEEIQLRLTRLLAAMAALPGSFSTAANAVTALPPGPDEEAGPKATSDSVVSNLEVCVREERREQPRGVYPQSVLAEGGGHTGVLMGRDLSAGGMRVERLPDLHEGARFTLAIYCPASADPLRLNAVVCRDDGREDLALRFENVPKETARELEKLVAALPDVESLERSESESMGTVLTEIVT